MTKNSIKGIEQGRAKEAYEFAKEGEQLGGGKRTENGKIEDSKQAKEYKSYVKKIPMLIKTNGLGATLAFVKSKSKKNAYNLIYLQLSRWLKESVITEDLFKNENAGKELVDVIICQKSANYRALTVEVLALFNWLRRFAEGLIQGEVETD